MLDCTTKHFSKVTSSILCLVLRHLRVACWFWCVKRISVCRAHMGYKAQMLQKVYLTNQARGLMQLPWITKQQFKTQHNQSLGMVPGQGDGSFGSEGGRCSDSLPSRRFPFATRTEPALRRLMTWSHRYGRKELISAHIKPTLCACWSPILLVGVR